MSGLLKVKRIDSILMNNKETDHPRCHSSVRRRRIGLWRKSWNPDPPHVWIPAFAGTSLDPSFRWDDRKRKGMARKSIIHQTLIHQIAYTLYICYYIDMAKMAFHTNLTVNFLREGKRFIAYSPALDLSTSGKTYEEARQRFQEAAQLFF